MVKKHLTKAVGLVLPFLVLVAGCSKDKEISSPQLPKQDVTAFEKQYSSSITYASDKSIRLIGYKKIKLNAKEAMEFERLKKNNPENLYNYFYDEADASVRVYFPVEAALVEHNNSLTEASEKGELNLVSAQAGNDQLTVVGRKQTALVTGVEGNVLKDGIIYLSQKNKSDHHIGNIYVFDFGYKMIMDHEHHHASSTDVVMEKASCMSNHGGGRNCSRAFNIYKGRCTFNASVCMDYNGWFTDCVNGKWSNFPGSDCDYALGAGHCWNEVM